MDWVGMAEEGRAKRIDGSRGVAGFPLWDGIEGFPASFLIGKRHWGRIGCSLPRMPPGATIRSRSRAKENVAEKIVSSNSGDGWWEM